MSTASPDSPEATAGHIPPDQVMAQLDRLLESAEFEASAPRREMLAFIVRETLSGRGDRLKGFSIATSVFGRSDDFDPQTDAVVRIEARRLRRDLDAWYSGPGQTDPVRIFIPKGRYIAAFEWTQPQSQAPADPLPAPSSARRRPAWRLAAVAAALAIVALGAGWSILSPGSARLTLSKPAVLVLPLTSARGNEVERTLAEGITHEVISNLSLFPDLRLFSPDETFRGGADQDLAALTGEDGFAYLVKGNLATNDEALSLSVQVLEARSLEIIWGATYTRPMSTRSLLDLKAELAGEIASAVGQPYGIVRNAVTASDDVRVPDNIASYHCVLRAYSYRRSFADRLRREVSACLDEAVKRDPRYAEAWAMRAWLLLDAGRFGNSDGAERDVLYRDAFTVASRAVGLDPTNIQALKALSSINHYLGHFDEGERLAREALRLNPHDPDTLAQLGWRIAIRGRFDEGVPLLHQAIERTISPPGWYYHLLAVEHMMSGDFDSMLAIGERAALDDSAIGHAFVAIAHAHLGHAVQARAALDRMKAASPRMGADPVAYFRTHQPSDDILEALRTGLMKAGHKPLS